MEETRIAVRMTHNVISQKSRHLRRKLRSAISSGKNLFDRADASSSQAEVTSPSSPSEAAHRAEGAFGRQQRWLERSGEVAPLPEEDLDILPLRDRLSILAESLPDSPAPELLGAYVAMSTKRVKYCRFFASGDTIDMEAARDSLREAVESLKSELWAIVRDFPTLAIEAPELLRAGAPIIEELEAVDDLLGNKKSSPEESSSDYVTQFQDELEKGARMRFMDLLERMVIGSPIRDILEEGDAIATDLFETAHSVAPAFPKHYEVIPFLSRIYMSLFIEAGRKLSARIIRDKGRKAEDVNREISAVMEWSANLRGRMVGLGLEKRLADAHEGSGALDPLVDEYCSRMSTFLGPALQRILELEVDEGVMGESPLRTSVATEVFRWLYAQVEQAKKCASSLLLSRVVAAIAQELCALQDRHLALLHDKFKDLGSEYQPSDYFAAVNDCLLCGQYATELAAEVMESIEPHHRAGIDFTRTIEAYRERAREMARLGVRKFLVENDLHSSERFVCQRLLVCVNDLFRAWRTWLFDEAFSLAAEVCLEVVAVACLEEFLSSPARFDLDLQIDLGEERRMVFTLFSDHVDSLVLVSRFQVLEDLKLVAFAEDKELLVLEWENLLKASWPQCPLAVVERIISLRKEFSRNDRNACFEECRDVHGAHSVLNTRENERFLQFGVRQWSVPNASAKAQQQVLASLGLQLSRSILWTV